MPSKQENFIRLALHYLIEERGLSQKEVCDKLQALNLKISRPSLSNLWREQEVSKKLLRRAEEGLQKILSFEDGLHYDADEHTLIPLPEAPPRKVIETTAPPTVKPPAYTIHDGRRDVHQKVAFYREAQVEIIEIGLRLRNFSQYFDRKRDTAFSDPLSELLARGIQFKCYVLDPQGNFARRYFDDRSKVHAFEKETLAESQVIIKDLCEKIKTINKQSTAGQMHLYYYDHFPYFHGTIIDGATEQAQALIAPYLYGVRRANTPVIEVSYQSHKKLYQRYWKSSQALIENQVRKIV